MPDTGLGGGGQRLSSRSTQMELTCVKWDLRKLLVVRGRCLGKWRGDGKWGREGTGKMSCARLAGSAWYTTPLPQRLVLITVSKVRVRVMEMAAVMNSLSRLQSGSMSPWD